MAKPEGVKIIREDGTELPCELVHLGVNEDGIDEWEIANATFRTGYDQLYVKTFPGHTSLTFQGGPSD